MVMFSFLVKEDKKAEKDKAIAKETKEMVSNNHVLVLYLSNQDTCTSIFIQDTKVHVGLVTASETRTLFLIKTHIPVPMVSSLIEWFHYYCTGNFKVSILCRNVRNI